MAGLTKLAKEAEGCTRCDLYRGATQTVCGAGPAKAGLMLIGEQPGDQEDKAGKAFVGPAGRLLDKALVAAEIDRGGVYVTNAVKHFKFEQRGKRRIHKTPSRTEVVACQPWLLGEINALQPDVVVLLGATAAKSLMGSGFRLTAQNALNLIGRYDIVADGSDNFATRYLVADACYFAKRPLVTAAIRDSGACISCATARYDG